MDINANTKIGWILKQHSDALEAIVSVDKKFEKLRNPILRKLIAARTSIATAAKIGNCSVEDFYSKLEPLGFKIDRNTDTKEPKTVTPEFVKSLDKNDVEEMDVRPIISSGRDPLTAIIQKINHLKEDKVLKVTNSFEPIPLINLLQKKGFETYVDVISNDLVATYFRKKVVNTIEMRSTTTYNDWDDALSTYKERLQYVDVRHLQMPMPMMQILEALETLPKGSALYVFHKKIPLFLLPELADKGFEYRIRELSEIEVHLLIFRK